MNNKAINKRFMQKKIIGTYVVGTHWKCIGMKQAVVVLHTLTIEHMEEKGRFNMSSDLLQMQNSDIILNAQSLKLPLPDNVILLNSGFLMSGLEKAYFYTCTCITFIYTCAM